MEEVLAACCREEGFQLLLVYGTFVLGVGGNRIGSVRTTWSMFRVLLKYKMCLCTEP